MRFSLVILLSVCCFSASAQWYHLDFKKHVRPEAIEQAPNHSIANLSVIKVNTPTTILVEQLGRSEYSYHANEYLILQTAQHNMRFRIYNDASYNFSDLAKIYIQQNRYAEAKWYLLQSNYISREQNDDKHTIANLIDLATIKAGLGDFTQAMQDLSEARNIAEARGFKDDMLTIDKKVAYLTQTRYTTPKVDVRYADAPEITAKAE